MHQQYRLETQSTAADLIEFTNGKADDYPYSSLFDKIHHSDVQTGSNQREHCLSWCEVQQPERPARKIYDSLRNASLLLWIAEAAGINTKKVEHAYKEAKSAYENKMTNHASIGAAVSAASSAVRSEISWDDVVSALQSANSAK